MTEGHFTEIRTNLDWGSLAPLRLRARLVAEGAYAGSHRSARRGAGVEFGGHREYVPGDDLRWLDRRSLLRHDRLQIRQFETETDRALRLVVDATSSMGYRGTRAKGAKLAYASLVAAALSRIALTGGDPVGLQFIGGTDLRSLPRTGGREQFERIVATLERAEAGGDARANLPMVEEAIGGLARTARRGALVVVLSDLLDLPDGADDLLCALASKGRILVVVQVLDPDEVDFPFGGTVRVRGMEGGADVETDADAAREQYIANLARLTETWERALAPRGGRLVRATTDSDPVVTVRDVIAKMT